MRYPALVKPEGRSLVVTFPACPGCVTQVDPGEDLAVQAAEALEGWLEATLLRGDVPPEEPPAARAPRGTRLLWVDVPARLAVKVSLRRVRTDAGLSQAQLGRRAGVSQQQIAKLEHPDANPSIDTLEVVARALGARLDVGLVPEDDRGRGGAGGRRVGAVRPRA